MIGRIQLVYEKKKSENNIPKIILQTTKELKAEESNTTSTSNEAESANDS